jgi:hypothetical protein
LAVQLTVAADGRYAEIEAQTAAGADWLARVERSLPCDS